MSDFEEWSHKKYGLISENMTKLQPSDVGSHQSKVVSWLDCSIM